MRRVVLGGWLAVTGCARPTSSTLVDFMRLLPAPTESDSSIRSRAELHRTTNAAGMRVVSIEVTPNQLDIVAGDEARLRERLSIVGRDSMHRVVHGWAPYYLASSGAAVRLHESGIAAVLPGTVEVFVRVSPFRDSTMRNVAPPSRASSSVFVTVTPRPYARPGRTPSDARGILNAWVAASGAEQWEDAVDYIDLERFAQFVNSRVASYRPPPPRLEMTLEQYIQANQRGGNTAPRAVLEWQYEQRQRSQRQQPDPRALSMQFAGVNTVEQLKALSVRDAAVRWLETMDPRTAARDAAKREHCDAEGARLLLSAATQHMRALGIVQYNDSVAWGYIAPTIWSPFLGTASAPVSVLLRRSARGPWRVDVQPEFRQVPGSGRCPDMQRSR